RCLENGVARHVVDVRPGRDADTANLRGERVGYVVAVQVERGDHIVFRRAGENLLQEGVCNDILYDQAVRQPAPRSAIDLHRAVLALCQLVAPVAETALRELHDVALVHERNALAAIRARIVDGCPNETVGSFLRHGLDAYRGRSGEANGFRTELRLQQL